MAAAWLTLAATRPVLAEFQIQEADIEKGEVEIEYRGAYHWGVPEATEENENANDLVQSHELELSMGISDWWLIQVTGGFDQPLHDNLEGSSVELETEFAMIKREGDGIAVSFQLGYEQAINNHKHLDDGEPGAFGFGPIVEAASGKFLLTLNPVFTKQIGTFADQEGLGFEYGWRGEYDLTKRWGVGVEMFGEIEDLANAGSFDDQVHSIGPTLFFNLGGDDDEAKGGDEDEHAKAGDDDDNGQAAGPPETSLSMNVGLQFGLTDATSDTALKFQGSFSF
jgi:hypothetical protein